VGKALARYLQRIRPQCASRRVFIRIHAPHQGFGGPSLVVDIVNRALKRAGLNPAHRGAHLLRHSLATRMLRGGASLTEIGKILRHHLTRTTAIYAKVDLAALRSLAQPWPGGEA
jgi:site-specific recombinase XerD